MDTTYRFLEILKWVFRNLTPFNWLGFDLFGRKTKLLFLPDFYVIKNKNKCQFFKLFTDLYPPLISSNNNLPRRRFFFWFCKPLFTVFCNKARVHSWYKYKKMRKRRVTGKHFEWIRVGKRYCRSQANCCLRLTFVRWQFLVWRQNTLITLSANQWVK